MIELLSVLFAAAGIFAAVMTLYLLVGIVLAEFANASRASALDATPPRAGLWEASKGVPPQHKQVQAADLHRLRRRKRTGPRPTRRGVGLVGHKGRSRSATTPV